MNAKKITVRVTLDIEIDPEAWNLIYGTGTTKAAITGDVRGYVRETFAQHSLVESGAILDVTETHKS